MSPHRLTLVAPVRDGVAAEVGRAAARRGASVTWHAPADLAARQVALQDTSCVVDGAPLTAVLWRVSPDMNLADGFTEADRRFATNETAATWIAALQLESIAAVNRFDAQAWYSGLRAQYWCDRLRAAGVRVAPACAGDADVAPHWRWHPYTADGDCDLPGRPARASMATACREPFPLSRHVSLFGTVPPSSAHPNVERAARLLFDWGIGLATIGSDIFGRVHDVRVLPVLDDTPLLAHVAERLTEYLLS